MSDLSETVEIATLDKEMAEEKVSQEVYNVRTDFTVVLNKGNPTNSIMDIE